MLFIEVSGWVVLSIILFFWYKSDRAIRRAYLSLTVSSLRQQLALRKEMLTFVAEVYKGKQQLVDDEVQKKEAALREEYEKLLDTVVAATGVSSKEGAPSKDNDEGTADKKFGGFNKGTAHIPLR